MANSSTQRKIFNDPVYGFISIPIEEAFKIIEHPYFQRLRRIKQLGLTHLVYPGALHTRFHHALGAMHLMTKAVEVIRKKGHQITNEEEKGVLLAILMHDMGHGPFSHTLENTLIQNIDHEQLSLFFMRHLNEYFDGALETGIAIFQNQHPKRFLHQLVSSQLDVDRLDYLRRDSFFTGVSEGVIGADRLIKMLDVIDDELVIEEKGVYSVENFIVARRIMYWQVYLHKTVVAAEWMLIKILKRAKHLSHQGKNLWGSPALQYFLSKKNNDSAFDKKEGLKQFADLDDIDVMSAIKVWQNNDDPVLSLLSQKLINRKLFKVKIQSSPFDESIIQEHKDKIQKAYEVSGEEADYFIVNQKLVNNAYSQKSQGIQLLQRDGNLMDVAEASDNFNIHALSDPVEKYFMCVPKID